VAKRRYEKQNYVNEMARDQADDSIYKVNASLSLIIILTSYTTASLPCRKAKDQK